MHLYGEDIENSVTEKNFFFFHYKSMGANDPRDMASLDLGAWLAGFM